MSIGSSLKGQTGYQQVLTAHDSGAPAVVPMTLPRELIKFEGLTSTEGYEQPSGAKRYLVAMPGNEKRRELEAALASKAVVQMILFLTAVPRFSASSAMPRSYSTNRYHRPAAEELLGNSDTQPHNRILLPAV
ncbi:MAG: hypothetical protein D6691_03015 [Candidatus Hydrogenedentota bacterium]|nr:MAG: hypothetical protein D6691_03015 [Candidatus Hydrogenedentota bacterium]